MSTTNRTTEVDTKTIISRIEHYLTNAVNGNHGYFKSREIANDLGLETRQVAALLSDVDEKSDSLSIERWAYSNCTTWLVETTN